MVSRESPATLKCVVEADPDMVNFRWTLSTGRETALVSREVPSDSGLSSILEYTPRRDADFGQLQCWAMNDIGKQKEPCIFNIIKEGEFVAGTLFFSLVFAFPTYPKSMLDNQRQLHMLRSRFRSICSVII